MKQLSTVIAVIVALAMVGLAALNWTTLNTAAPLDLAVAQIHAPLGIVMLGLAAVLVLLFFIAWLRTQITALVETRRLLKEIQRVQDVADKAEASRIENLRLVIMAEFRSLNERMQRIEVIPSPREVQKVIDG
ncbi:LapA family protein [Piscinibacter sakaiensis]|uniref:LapA family protein n=1 Tax=Piscinibacter sakaiensis TaxID=1547922 RepID=UPI003AAA745A